ncbi:peptidase S8 [Clostridioides difficile]|nr:peptidase S8 [Clostridioides difficile]
MEKSYCIIYQGDIESALQENGINRYMVLNSQLVVIYVPIDFDETILNNIIQVAWWEESEPMSSLIEITNNVASGETITTAAETEYIYENPYNDITGRGILLAVIDSGIDYLHPDFINDDGTSKVLYLWDQEANTNPPPEGFIFGSQFTRSELNIAISRNDGSLSQDNIGTGTLVSGILVGNGRVNSQYRGITTESDLIVVKLKSYTDTYYAGRINYSVSDFLAAITYVTNIARTENKPMIINLTIGVKSGAVATTSILDSFNILSSAGVVVVSGAGNQGNTDIHYSGRFSSVGEVQDVIIQDGDDYALDITLNTNGPDKIGAQIISPSGEVSHDIRYSPDFYIYRGKFNLENTTYAMRFIYPYITSGKENLEIRLRDIKPGVWILRLTSELIIGGEYDIYLPNKNLIAPDTRFLDPDSVATITMYAASDDVITVGTFNNKTDSMWIGSSKGPIRGRGIKPDIVASGVDIISTYKNGTYNTGTGTGVSSSIVTGVLALLMEYLEKQNNIPRLSLFTQVLKTYLILGATKLDIYTYPNVSQGYGILNLKNTIQQIANTL